MADTPPLPLLQYPDARFMSVMLTAVAQDASNSIGANSKVLVVGLMKPKLSSFTF